MSPSLPSCHYGNELARVQGRGCVYVMTVILTIATIQSRRGTRPDDPAATGFGTVPTPSSMGELCLRTTSDSSCASPSTTST